eukprot:NODE_181_length_13917_cov_0.838110.p1 type:complete len:721 gc:universal NODE_181_length_13917_cov_0.838110:8533-10695(+)
MVEVSEFQILSTYKINNLNPEYWMDIQIDDIAVDTNNVMTGAVVADSDPLGVYSSVLEQSSSKEKKTRATSIFIRDNVVLDGTVNIQGIVQNQNLMIFHPQFDPFLFLLKVHADTTYHDIAVGMKKLEQDVEENKDELRTLIRNHFDQFILAQKIVEALHDDMRKKYQNEIPKEVSKFARSVRETQIKFKEQMQPLLERNDRIQGVQESLRALEKVKVFSDIPNQIKDFRAKKKYESSVILFHQGKRMLSEVLKSNNPSKIQYFNLVWTSALEQITIMQNELMELLEDDQGNQEDTLILLMELEFSDVALWNFIEERSKRLMRSISQDIIAISTLVVKEENHDEVIHSDETKDAITKILKSSNARSIELAYSKKTEFIFWKRIYEITQSIVETLCGPFNDFWKLTQIFLGENFKDIEFKEPQKLPELEKTKTLIEELVTFISDKVTDFWLLNDSSSVFDQKSKSPLLLCYFFERILNELSRAERDLSSMKFSNGELGSKKILAVFERIKLKGLMIASSSWIQESKVLGQSSNHIDASEFQEFDNATLNLFSLYQRQVLKDILSIASYSSILDGDILSPTDIVSFYSDNSGNNIHPMIIEKIRDSFVDSLHNFIEEMTRSVTESSEKMKTDDSLPLKCLAQIRILKEKLIPDLIARFQTQTQTSLSSSALKVFKLINDMDESIFLVYVASKSAFVQSEIEKTWNMKTFNWCMIREPQRLLY